MVAFGYTFCLDVCPIELASMAAALDALGEDAKKIQPMFISIDPERDTPERLREYVANFYPRNRSVGVSGNDCQSGRRISGEIRKNTRY